MITNQDEDKGSMAPRHDISTSKPENCVPAEVLGTGYTNVYHHTHHQHHRVLQATLTTTSSKPLSTSSSRLNPPTKKPRTSYRCAEDRNKSHIQFIARSTGIHEVEYREIHEDEDKKFMNDEDRKFPTTTTSSSSSLLLYSRF
ncbi:hypothetical protein M413DRAFT_27541 [Hebeloma cylindrosporum]|uniref:Uncharacterized protein n=1 Tax=Hebeloma cylindrosporum TaxID=76867 RepID=A0A0C2YLX3_HEBCY|nr:hypothetical protein M413DRAFT_27541 [Hebeloma cylindrosporum h7]